MREPEARRDTGTITPREYQVVKALLSGLNESEVAEQLVPRMLISNVHHAKRRVTAAMGCKTFHQALARMIEEGLIHRSGIFPTSTQEEREARDALTGALCDAIGIDKARSLLVKHNSWVRSTMLDTIAWEEEMTVDYRRMPGLRRAYDLLREMEPPL